MLNIKYIATLILLLTVTSCTDFLEEQANGKLTNDSFFNSKQDLESSLNALYSVVTTSQRANNYVGTNFLSGDDISTHPASNKQSLREHDQYNVTDNNAWMVSMWEQRYKVIKAANFIINNAEKTQNVAQSEIDAALGQAYFWRAFSYFYLVTTWGAVPKMMNDTIDYDTPLSSVEKIYEQIISDMTYAEDMCPAKYEKAPYFQNGVNIAVSKGAVKAAMSYIYMCMAGWPLNLGEKYYTLAANKAEEVINLMESDKENYYYSLLENYADVYSLKYSSSNPEIILGLYYHRDRSSHSMPLTDFLFDMKQGGWGDTNGEIKFWKEFPEGPRKDATYFPKIMLADGKLYDWWYDTEPASREVVAPVFIKTAEAAARGEEFDYTDPTAGQSSGQKTLQVIRLSELYCWYAEATGRSGKVTQKAVDMLNRVRNRADGTTSNIYSTSMTPEELAEAAYNEHGWEIAGYYWCGFASRSRDMFRMYRFKEHFEYRKKNPMIEVAPGIMRNEKVPVTGEWSDTKMYCPYPYEDKAMNDNLL